ncbi:MAG: hypothetical protein FJX68_17350 [Alphaproteobacteria bacterium]|nr:hypothetical protein [Alphaproteobacteria bacterium]
MRTTGMLATALTAGLALATGGAAAQDKTFNWRFTTVAGANTIEFKELGEGFAEKVEKASKGRLVIKAFPSGVLMKDPEAIDALAKGTIQMAVTYLVYFSGKEPALRAVNEWPALVDPLQGVTWFYAGGGAEIMRPILERHGMYFLGVSPLSGEHIWSKNPLPTVDALKGLKIRAAGLAADSFARMGAAVVNMSGVDVYQGLQRGTVDAAEFTTLPVNYEFGFAEVTKHVIFPSYSGGGTYDWAINKKAWDELPEDLKTIMHATLGQVGSQYFMKAILAERKVMDELKKKNMNFITWSEKDMKALELARIAVMRERYAKESEDFAKILKSRLELLQTLGYDVPPG